MRSQERLQIVKDTNNQTSEVRFQTFGLKTSFLRELLVLRMNDHDSQSKELVIKRRDRTVILSHDTLSASKFLQGNERKEFIGRYSIQMKLADEVIIRSTIGPDARSVIDNGGNRE